MRKILILVVVLCFLFTNPSLCWWNNSWQYRKPITINNTANSNNLTDYQVLVRVDTAILISEGKMRSDCGDIRFVDSDDNTELSYWIESGCNTTNTTIWVKVPFIPANSSVDIFMYYGSQTVESASDAYEASAGFGSDFKGIFNSASIKQRYLEAMQKVADYIEEDYISHGSTGQIGTNTDDVRSQEICEFFAYMYVVTGQTKYKDMAINIANWAIDNLQTDSGAFLEEGASSYPRTAFFTWALGSTYKMLEEELDDATKTKWQNSMRNASDWLYDAGHPPESNQVMAEMLAHYYVYLCTNDTTYKTRAEEHRSIIETYWVQVEADKGYFKEQDGYDRHYSQLHICILIKYYKVSNDDYFNNYCQQIWNWLRDAIDFNTFWLDTSGNTRTTGSGWVTYARKLCGALELGYGIITDPEYDVREIARKAFLSVIEPEIAFHSILRNDLDWTCSDLMKSEMAIAHQYFVESPDLSFEWRCVGNIYMWSEGGWSNDNHFAWITNKGLRVKVGGGLDVLGLYSTQNFTDFVLRAKASVIETTNYGVAVTFGCVQDNTVAWTPNSMYHNEIGYDNQDHTLRKREEGAITILASSSFTFNLNEWVLLELRKTDSNLEGRANEQVLSATDTTFSSGYVGISGYTSTVDFDFVFVRKYTEPEPSVSIGAEETA